MASAQKNAARIDRLRRIFEQAGAEVDAEVASLRTCGQLEELGSRLCNSIDDDRVGRVRRMHAEFAANPRHAGLQGGAGEIWTFRDGGDVDISFPLPLVTPTPDAGPTPVRLGESGDNGDFRLIPEPNGNESQLWYLQTLRRLSFRYHFKAMVALFALQTFVIQAFPLMVVIWSWGDFEPSQSYYYDYAIFSSLVALQLLTRSRMLGGSFSNTILNKIQTKILSFVGRLFPRNLFLWLEAESIHGPAMTNASLQLGSGSSLRTVGVDAVTYVHAPSDVEGLLHEWRARHCMRFNNTPGFVRVVPAAGDLGVVMYDTERQLWRMSLTEFECQWIRNLRKEQGIALSLAKRLAKCNNLTRHPIVSYPIKMSFFWLVYFNSDGNWLARDVCFNALKVLRFLKICIEQGMSLPNYFYLEENVLNKYLRVDSKVEVPQIGCTVEYLCSTDALENDLAKTLAGIKELLKSGRLRASNTYRANCFLWSSLCAVETVNMLKVKNTYFSFAFAVLAAEVLFFIVLPSRESNDFQLILFTMIYKLGATLLALPIALIVWNASLLPLYVIERIKSLWNKDGKLSDTRSVVMVRELFTRVCEDLRLSVGGEINALKSLSRSLREGFSSNSSCLPLLQKAFKNAAFHSTSAFAVSSNVTCKETYGKFKLICGSSSRVAETLCLACNTMWIEAALSLLVMALVMLFWDRSLPKTADEILYFVFELFAALILPNVIVLLNRYPEFKLDVFHALRTKLQRLPLMQQPSRLSLLFSCLTGTVKLRIRIENCDKPLHLIMTDARKPAWRFCSNLLERERLSQMTEAQSLCYFAALSLAKRLEATQSNFEPVRMAFHWLTELAPESQWTVDNVLYNALIVLELCRRCHRRGILPNFFHPAENVASINAEAFFGLPKSHIIVAHLLFICEFDELQANLKGIQDLQSDFAAVSSTSIESNAADLGCGMLTARAFIAASDFIFRILICSLVVIVTHIAVS